MTRHLELSVRIVDPGNASPFESRILIPTASLERLQPAVESWLTMMREAVKLAGEASS